VRGATVDVQTLRRNATAIPVLPRDLMYVSAKRRLTVGDADDTAMAWRAAIDAHPGVHVLLQRADVAVLAVNASLVEPLLRLELPLVSAPW